MHLHFSIQKQFQNNEKNKQNYDDKNQNKNVIYK